MKNDDASKGIRKIHWVLIIPIVLLIMIAPGAIIYFIEEHTTTEPKLSESEINGLNSGYWRFASGDYEGASLEFYLLILRNPDLGEAYMGRGLVHQAVGEYDEAILDYDKAIELLPDLAMGYNNRGIAYFAKGEFEAGIVDLDKAIELNGRFAKAYYNRGLIYLAENDFVAAIADFDKAIEFSPESGQVDREMLSGEGATENLFFDAREVFDYMALLGTEADLALVYANRGLAYMNKGDLERAAVDLEKAVELGLVPGDREWVEMLVEELE